MGMLSSVVSIGPPLCSRSYVPIAQRESLNDLFIGQPVQAISAGEGAFWEGDAASHVALVAEGCLRLSCVLPDGRRVVMGFAFKNEIIGLSCSGTYAHTAEAVAPAGLRQLPMGRFLEAVDNSPVLRMRLLAQFRDNMTAAQQHMILLACFSAEERIASFLLSAARRMGTDRDSPVVVHLPMSRLDLADHLGLTAETVCRTLSKFKRAKMIECLGRHAIAIQRSGMLRRLIKRDGAAHGSPTPLATAEAA